MPPETLHALSRDVSVTPHLTHSSLGKCAQGAIGSAATVAAVRVQPCWDKHVPYHPGLTGASALAVCVCGGEGRGGYLLIIGRGWGPSSAPGANLCSKNGSMGIRIGWA